MTRETFERVAADTAHEIAGPLSAVGAAIELLDGVEDRTEARQLIETARRQLDLAQRLIDRLSRLQEGPSIRNVEPTDLVGLAEQLVDDLRSSVLAEHPVEVQAEGPLVAEVDAEAISQVLFNLLVNAARHSPAGRDIVVSLAQAEGAVQIRVRDQGHGVAPEDAERIFARYERGETSRGAGLGLAIARDIAQAHDGSLELEPASLEGAIFVLTLPLTRP